MLARILLIDLGFFGGTLGTALPIAAKFVVDQMKCRKIGPLGFGTLLDDFLHDPLLHAFAPERLTLFCGGRNGNIPFLDLSSDMGAALKRFSRQLRLRSRVSSPQG